MGDAKLYRFYARMSSAVFLKIFLAVGGYFLGRELDIKYGTDPYLMLGGFIVGISLGLWWVIRVANQDSGPSSDSSE